MNTICSSKNASLLQNAKDNALQKVASQDSIRAAKSFLRPSDKPAK